MLENDGTDVIKMEPACSLHRPQPREPRLCSLAPVSTKFAYLRMRLQCKLTQIKEYILCANIPAVAKITPTSWMQARLVVLCIPNATVPCVYVFLGYWWTGNILSPPQLHSTNFNVSKSFALLTRWYHTYSWVVWAHSCFKLHEMRIWWCFQPFRSILTLLMLAMNNNKSAIPLLVNWIR